MLLERLEKDLSAMKTTTGTVLAKLQDSENRAKQVESNLEKERRDMEEKLKTAQSKMKEEAEKQILEAEQRVEAILKRMKNIEQESGTLAHTRLAVGTDFDMPVDRPDIIVDKAKQRTRNGGDV